MPRIRTYVSGALLVALCGAISASAQVANLSVVSGNGQLCCTVLNNANFQPLVVKATDAAGNPVANTIITWTITTSGALAGSGNLIDPSGAQDPGASVAIRTDTNGLATVQFQQNLLPLQGELNSPYVQNSIQAAANSGSPAVTFVSKTALRDPSSGVNLVTANAPLVGGFDPSVVPPLAGQSGTQFTTPIQLRVAGQGLASAGVPGVSIRLVIPADQAATIACVTGAGADPGSVLSDANGLASCTPVFGGSGSGTYFVLAGGITNTDPTVAPIGYAIFGPYSLGPITPAAPGLVTIVSGNAQSVNPGQAIAVPLTAKVTDAAGANPIPNAQVTWTVSPAGAGTLTNTIATSDVNGQVSTSLTLAATASGAVQVKVALASNANVSATFTVNVNTVISGLQKLSGDSQNATRNTAFTQPLVVQVNDTRGNPVPNTPVQFAIAASSVGTATLSAAAVSTNNSGQASITVTAGSAAGAVAVTASSGGFTQTFNLTVALPGPTLTQSGFLNGASFQAGSISPCSIATIVGTGIAPTVQGVVVANLSSFGFGLLPFALAGDTVSFGGSQAPIYNVANVGGQQQVSVQVPCDVTPGNVQVTVNVNGATANITVPVGTVSPGIFQTTMSDGVVRAVMVRADGSFMSPSNPARLGERVRAYLTGMGQTSPAIATNEIDNPGADLVGKDATVTGSVVVGITNNAGQGAGVTADSVRYAPDLIGVYEVAFQIPFDAATGNSVTFSISITPAGGGTQVSSLGSKIIVQ
ncbi:MAG: hypothetical protein LAP87_18240 [Acidobacteriia bacterium]|nr:hypothetical protein [Terriglobia bacterium]